MRQLVLALVHFTALALCGQGTVSGRIIDDHGETLPGASITVKETPGVGVAADLDGRYSIRIGTTGPITLVFNYILFEPRELVVEPKGRPVELNVMLLPLAGEQEVILCGVAQSTYCTFGVAHPPVRIEALDTVVHTRAKLYGQPEDEKDPASQLVLYPNPNKNGRVILRIADAPNAHTVKVEVTDPHGARVYEQRISTVSGPMLGTIDLGADLPSGVYMVTVVVEDQRFTERLVKN